MLTVALRAIIQVYEMLCIHNMLAQSKTGGMKIGILPENTTIQILDERH